jgi:ABC-type cobalamin/Fe3+-siderophores transport system ATPase subunit
VTSIAARVFQSWYRFTSCPDRTIDIGTPEEVLVPEALEAAYGVPSAMLYDTESLSRKVMLEQDQANRGR